MAKRPQTPPAKKPTVHSKSQVSASPLRSSKDTWLSAALALLAGLMLFCYTEKVLDPTLLPKFIPYALWILGASTFVFLYQKKEISVLLKAKGFFFSYFVFLVVSGLSLLSAKLWGDAIFQWAKPFLGFQSVVILCLLFVEYLDFRNLFSKILSLFALLGGIIGLYQLSKLDDFSHESLYTVNSLFAHKNIFCEILLLCLPFSMYQGFQGKGLFKGLSYLSAIVTLALLVMLLSRAVWIAGFISLGITLVLYFIVEKKHKGISAKTTRNLLLAFAFSLVFIVSAALIYTKVTHSDVIQKQFGALIDVKHEANQGRLHFWEHSVTLWNKQPLWGIGLENWKIDVLDFPTTGTESEDGGITFQRPHNDYLWILSESGIFALISHLLLFGFCFFYLIKHLLRENNQQARGFSYATFMGLLSYMIFATFAFPKERIEETFLLHLLFTFSILPSLQMQPNEENATDKKGSLGMSIALFLPLTCYLLYIGYDRYQAEIYLREFNALKDEANAATSANEKMSLYNKALDVLKKAERPNYQLDPMTTSLRFYAGTIHLQMGQTENFVLREQYKQKNQPFPTTLLPSEKNYYDLAKQALEAASKMTPHHVQTSNNLGSTYYLLGKKEDAVALYCDAVRVCPRYGDPAMSLAYLYYADRKYDSAYYTMEAIDTTYKSSKYPIQFRLIREALFKRAIQDVTEPILLEKIGEILADKKWTQGVHNNVKAKHIVFRKALLGEAIYWLRKDEKIDDIAKKLFEEKYLGD
ncbi:MAG: O-antigen ligase family protein [Bacteroidia bacterium]